MTNLAKLTVNPNFEALRKTLGFGDVSVYPEMMVYKLQSPKVAASAAVMALRTIKQMKLPLNAYQPSLTINTFYIKEIAA
jgi:hypothetical protein